MYKSLYLYMTVKTVQEQLLTAEAHLSPPKTKHFLAGMSFY